ncbi:MAG: hypothetical protein ACRCZZ_10975 [Phocaeicola sp.]
MTITYEKLELLVMFASIFGIEMVSTSGEYSEYLKDYLSNDVLYLGLTAVEKFLEEVAISNPHPQEFFKEFIRNDFRKNN